MRAELADGTVLEFPDNTLPEVVQATVARMIAGQKGKNGPGAGTKALRAAEFGARGFNDSVAETLGAIPELAASGLRAVGLPAPNEGYYPAAIKSGVQKFGEILSAPLNAAVDFGPAAPQSSLERGAYGAGRGVADAGAFMVPGAATVRLAKAGSLPARVGGAMVSQPGAQMLAGATAGGVTDATDNAGYGLAASLALPTGASALKAVGRKAITPFPSQLSPNEQRLAQAAQDMGIKLTPGQVTGSPALRTMESTFAQLPLTSKTQGAKYADQRTAFNRGVLEKAGIYADDASPEVLEKSFRAIGKEFDDLAANTTIKPDQQLVDELAGVTDKYGRRLTSDVARVFDSYMDDFTKMQSSMQKPGASVEIAGTEYQNLSSDIKRRARKAGSNPDLKEALLAFSGKLDDALERSAGPELRGAWKDVRNRYRNMLTVDSAMGVGNQGERSAANIPFSGLRTAVKGMDKSGYARGRGDLNQASRVADFLGSAIPADSGTARRGLMQNLLQGAPLGAGATYSMMGGSPVVGAGIAAGSVLGPKAVQLGYDTPAVQAYLKNQMMKPSQNKRSLSQLLAKIATAQAIGQQTE